jgi:hypothetical protein
MTNHSRVPRSLYEITSDRMASSLAVACFEKIIEGYLDRVPQLAEAELREALTTVRNRSRAITGSDIAKVCAAWREMQARWDELPVGESIRIEWRSVPVPGKKHRR